MRNTPPAFKLLHQAPQQRGFLFPHIVGLFFVIYCMKRLWFILPLLLILGCGVPVIPSNYIILDGEQDFYINKDEFTSTDFIQHISSFTYRISSGAGRFFHLYIVEGTGHYNIRAKFECQSGGWVFFDSIYMINEKGDKISWKNIKSWDKRTQVTGGGGTYESFDLLINNYDLELLRSVLMGKNVKCRFSGDSYDERVLLEVRRAGALQTINLYDRLKKSL